MKNIIILLTFLWAITSYAVAPYGIKGQQQAATLYSNVHQFPNNQVTNLGGINALVETGNTNILSNPSFEHSTFSTSWTNSAGTFTQETSVVIDGKASAKLVLAAQTMSLTQSSTLYQAQFADGVQGLAMVRIKSDIALSVCSIQAGTVSTTNCVTTATDSKWGLYKIPFVMGATSQGVSIASTGSVTGTVYVDDAFVGGINLESQNGACITSDCTTTFSARVSATGVKASDILSVFTTSRSALGTYSVNYSSLGLTSVPSVVVQLNSGGGSCDAIRAQGSTTTAATIVTGASGFGTLADCAFEVIIQKQNTDFTQAEAKKTGNVFTTQCGANCVDTFSAAISSTGVVSNENLEWIQSTSSGGTGIRNITFSTGTFSVAPNCVTTVNDSSRTTNITSVTNSSIQVRTFLTAVLEDRGFNIVCQKQGADFVATRTIQGSFNEVVTSPGISKPKTCEIFNAGATNATTCTGSPCTEYFDSCGTASACTRGGVGTYTCAFGNGTFSPSSYVSCGSGTSTSVTGSNIGITDANGAYSLTIRGFSNTLAATADIYFSAWCKGQAQ